MIEIIPAPLRAFKTYTMWIGIAIGSADALVLLLQTFGDLHIMSTTAVLAVNAVLGFLIVPARLVLQSVPATTEEKIDLITGAAAQPMKPGEANVEVHVNGTPLSTTPSKEIS